MRMQAIIGLTFLINASLAVAATVVDAKVNGSELIVSGSGFGNENPMAFWDDTSSEFAELGLSEGSNVPSGSSNKWKQAGPIMGGDPLTFKKNTNSKTLKPDTFYFTKGDDAILGSPNLTNDNVDQEIYVSWWYRPSKSPLGEGGSNKFIRIWDNPDGQGTRISWTQMHLTCGTGGNVSWGNWVGNIDEWNHQEIYVNNNTSTVQAWVNGIVNHNTNNCPKASGGQGYKLFIYLIGFNHNLDAYADMENSLDDFYVGNSKKRIEVTNNKVWSPTSERDIIPIISWSDTEVVGRLFSTSKVRYSKEMFVHFIGADGAPIGEGVSLLCETCPKL